MFGLACAKAPDETASAITAAATAWNHRLGLQVIGDGLFRAEHDRSARVAIVRVADRQRAVPGDRGLSEASRSPSNGFNSWL
jgi:hypothetical protein